MNIGKLILTILGILILGLMLYYIIINLIAKNIKNNTKLMWPPSRYMEMNGAQCPDYWVNTSSNIPGEHKCVNKFNIPVIPRTELPRCANVNCFDENSSNTKSFNTINRWPVKDKNELTERCLWRDCCVSDKLHKNIPASWVGIDEACNY